MLTGRLMLGEWWEEHGMAYFFSAHQDKDSSLCVVLLAVLVLLPCGLHSF